MADPAAYQWEGVPAAGRKILAIENRLGFVLPESLGGIMSRPPGASSRALETIDGAPGAVWCEAPRFPEVLLLSDGRCAIWTCHHRQADTGGRCRRARKSNSPPGHLDSFQDCTGCTETLLRTSHPDLGDLILNIISLEYHETLMAGSGRQAEEASLRR